jgi:LuxR family maltose regulon positive regulatory protein
VLRLKLRLKYPERMPDLYRRAARLCEQSGSLTHAVRHAAKAGDWQLAARMVINGLAITEIMRPQRGQSLPGEFVSMPHSEVWDEPHPYLVSAAASLARGERESCVAALAAAESILASLPAEQEVPGRLAAAMLRLAVSRQTGDLPALVAAAGRAEALVGVMPGEMLARHPAIRASRLAARGMVELWLGHLDEAVRVLDAGVAAAPAPGAEHEQAECLGYLALAEGLRGGLCRAAELAAQAAVSVTAGELQPPVKRSAPSAAVAMALVHLERNEMRETRSLLKQADTALGASPDKLIGTVAWLVAARAGLAEGRAEVTAQFVAKARAGWRVPAWLERELTQVEVQACLAAGHVQAALAIAERVDPDSSQGAIVQARAWAAAGDASNARRALSPALAAHHGAEPVRLQAWLVDAQLSYNSGNHARGHRSLAFALSLAEREQFRLPFVLERGWMKQALERDPELARGYQRLLAPILRRNQLPAPLNAPAPDQPAIVAVEPLTEREREVLRHVSDMLNTAEVASEMYISINTVKTHLKSIFRKLAATHRGEAVRRAQQLELI